VPYFGSRPITAVETDDIEAFTAFLLNKGRGKKGLAPKTVRNILGFLHQVFEHGIARKLIRDNPVRHAEKPGRKKSGANPDLQFLTVSELEAVIRQIPDEVVIRKPKPTRKGHRGPSLHHLPMFLAPS
jgi:site-specific recombinase XerD